MDTKYIKLIDKNINRLNKFISAYPSKRNDIYINYLDLVMVRNMCFILFDRERLKKCNKLKRQFVKLIDKYFREIPETYFIYDSKNLKFFKEDKNDDYILYKRMSDLDMLNKQLEALKAAANIIESDEIIQGMLRSMKMESNQQLVEYIKSDIKEIQTPELTTLISERLNDIYKVSDGDKTICANLLKNYKEDFTDVYKEAYISQNKPLEEYLNIIEVPTIDVVREFYDVETDVSSNESSDSDSESDGASLKRKPAKKSNSKKSNSRQELKTLNYTEALNDYKNLKIPSREELKTKENLAKWEESLKTLEETNANMVKRLYKYYNTAIALYISKRIREEDYMREIEIYKNNLEPNITTSLQSATKDVAKVKEILYYLSTRYQKSLSSEEGRKKANVALKYFFVGLIGMKSLNIIGKKLKEEIDTGKLKKISDIYNFLKTELFNFVIVDA